MKTRKIIHVDMDAFFASVEIINNPALRGKAVIVGGHPDRRGVVSTCSYEARKFGIHSSMPLSEAKRRCPHAIFLEGNFDLYAEYSRRIIEILYLYTAAIEVVSIDEAYMDITEEAESFGGAFKLGQHLRRAVFETTNLTCSVGIGSNKLIAKIASSLGKPNGLYEIPPGTEVDFLAPLAVEYLPGIGAKTQDFLNRDNIKTIKDLQDLGLDALLNRYGSHGYIFYMSSLAKDNRPVNSSESSPKSIGAEITFEIDLSDRDILFKKLIEMFQKAHKRLIRYRMRARGISLKMRYSDFRTISRACTFDSHTNDYEFLLKHLTLLFDKYYAENTPLRLIGVSLEKLTDLYWQPTFWDWQSEQEL